MLRPYRAGRIPVVLVHGTASAPAWWANLLNDLQSDPELRDRYQFWLFRYGTASPILYSASLLRETLRQTVADLDSEGRDAALRRMVLVGHSQGGLLCKLAVIESGTLFWDAISDRPIDSYDLQPQARASLDRVLFFSPLPFVRRVIFMATPHGGSFRASPGLADLLKTLITLPIEVVKLPLELLASDESRLSEELRSSNSVHSMTPGSLLLETLAKVPISERVTTHSIIAVDGDGPVEEGNDGIVEYSSAHIEGVESELVVRSTHSVQMHPLGIREVDRILREHAGAR
jgi:pimeloyl-ACP methyl ester carboxylesterase